MKLDKGTTTPGFENPKRQRVIRRTALEGNLPGVRVYVVRCSDCGIEYGANGCDIHIRRCPHCQSGASSCRRAD